MREIGDFVAHSDERIKGVTTEEVRDFFTSMRFFFGRRLDASIRSPEFIPAIQAVFRRFDTRAIKQITGLTRKAAERFLSSALAKVFIGEDGHIHCYTPLHPQELSILETCMNRFTVRPVFTEERLYNDFCFVLRKNNLLTPSEMAPMRYIRPGLTLYAVASMHLVHLDLGDGSKASLQAVVQSDLIAVAASAEMCTPFGTRTAAASIFTTNLKAAEWCHADLLSPAKTGMFLTCPLEVTYDQKLVPLR